MRSSSHYVIIDDFFPHLLQMLDQLKAKEHWVNSQHPLRPDVGDWPGKRSLNYVEDDPALTSLFITCAGHFFPQNFNSMALHTHWRFGNDADWVHVDPAICTGLVYLSETNMSSGTMFFDKRPEDGGQVILDVPFVQNRCVLFFGQPYHCSKSNYGDSESNARFTMNFFAS